MPSDSIEQSEFSETSTAALYVIFSMTQMICPQKYVFEYVIEAPHSHVAQKFFVSLGDWAENETMKFFRNDFKKCTAAFFCTIPQIFVQFPEIINTVLC